MNFNLFLFVLFINQVKSQSFIDPTDVDNLVKYYRQVTNGIYTSLGRNSEDPKNLEKARSLNLLQDQVPLSVKFPCNVTGFRSATPPTNVNKVRPGDIDIVAAIGDSLIVGNGLVATNILQVLIGNRGLVWCIGGQKTWREFLTLPNILKEFNPNLFGYSLTDSLTRQRESQFNVAEFAAFSSELPFMTEVLMTRIKADPRVDLKNHWKLITLLMGTNNFCLDMCVQSDPEAILKYHREDLLATFRIIKKNLPRTIINMVSPYDSSLLPRIEAGKPPLCQILNTFECMCILRKQYAHHNAKFKKIIRKWQKLEEEIADMDEFNTDDFAILYQPFTHNIKVPKLTGNFVDTSYLSMDCYHPSQKLNAEAGNALWNNMMEKRGNKSLTVPRLFERFLCPSEKEPYIFTKRNSVEYCDNEENKYIFDRLHHRNTLSFITCQNSFAPSSIDDITLLHQAYTFARLAIGRSSEEPLNLRSARKENLLQKIVPLSVPFPCDVTGFRSSEPPSSVHQLRPGDIDLVGAIGDSLTGGFGLVATTILQVIAQNRGLAWSIGGQGTWRQYLTVPNILKEFNPNLFGYSLGDSLSTERKSQFNPAEGAAISSEMPFMAEVLIKRIKNDKRVDLKNHWKLITLSLGSNDMCLDVCYHKNSTGFLELHRQDMIKVLRLLRDNLPRTIVNFVAPIDMKKLIDQRGTPETCQFIHQTECYCLFNNIFTPNLEKYFETNRQMNKIDEEVANMPEFHKNKDFTVVFQPFLSGLRIPLVNETLTDWSFMSKDCFHLSQKMNARVGNALWNNMLQKIGKKSTKIHPLFDKFLCPTKENPYIFTNANS